MLTCIHGQAPGFTSPDSTWPLVHTLQPLTRPEALGAPNPLMAPTPLPPNHTPAGKHHRVNQACNCPSRSHCSDSTVTQDTTTADTPFSTAQTQTRGRHACHTKRRNTRPFQFPDCVTTCNAQGGYGCRPIRPPCTVPGRWGPKTRKNSTIHTRRPQQRPCLSPARHGVRQARPATPTPVPPGPA